MTSKVGGNSDSRRQTGRDSEIAPTNMKSCKKQQNYHVTSTSRLYHTISPISIPRSSGFRLRRGRSPKSGRKYPAPSGER